MKKIMSMIMAAMVFLTIGTGYVQAQDKTSDSASELPKVYLIKEITPENLVKIYEALGRKAEGKVAVKLSTGEPGGHNFLQPTLIAPLVRKMNGTIVECNTAYGGGRANTEAHLKAAADHGFTAIAKVDIMDADGEVSLPVKGGKHLKEDFVGKNYLNYDFTVVLSHFKGHAMGGFGGAIKNISIGMYVSSFFRFKTDGIVDGLVSNNGISGDVDKAYWFCGCDNSCHILINGELFDFLIRLLSHRGEGCQNTYRQCADSFKSLQFHNIYVFKLFSFVV